jgi:hypothetical protein
MGAEKLLLPAWRHPRSILFLLSFDKSHVNFAFKPCADRGWGEMDVNVSWDLTGRIIGGLTEPRHAAKRSFIFLKISLTFFAISGYE